MATPDKNTPPAQDPPVQQPPAKNKKRQIRVQLHVPIPHKVILPPIGEVVFDPEPNVDLDDDQQNKLLKISNMYEVSDGKQSRDNYRTRATSQFTAVTELFEELQPGEREKVLAYGRKIVNDRKAEDQKQRNIKEESEKKRLAEEQDKLAKQKAAGQV